MKRTEQEATTPAQPVPEDAETPIVAAEEAAVSRYQATRWAGGVLLAVVVAATYGTALAGLRRQGLAQQRQLRVWSLRAALCGGVALAAAGNAGSGEW